MRPLLPQDIHSTSSGSGMSFWLKYVNCPRRGTWGESNDDLTFGSYEHKLLELYYAQTLSDYDLEYAEPVERPLWVNALSMFAAYRKIYSPTELGDVIAVEYKMESVRPEEIFGVPKFTGQLDLLVRLSESDCEALMLTRPDMGLLEAGVYIVDHKTSALHNKYGKNKYDVHKWDAFSDAMRRRIQFTGYARLLLETHPDLTDEFRGTIVSVMFKDTKPYTAKNFLSLHVPPPSASVLGALKQTLSTAVKLQEVWGPEGANTERCGDYGGCQHLKINGGTCQ